MRISAEIKIYPLADNVPLDAASAGCGTLAALSAVNIPDHHGASIEWDVTREKSADGEGRHVGDDAP